MHILCAHASNKAFSELCRSVVRKQLKRRALLNECQVGAGKDVGWSVNMPLVESTEAFPLPLQKLPPPP